MYPFEAAWATSTMPPRVRPDGQRYTVGRIKIGDQEIPGEIVSNKPDVWVTEAAERLRETVDLPERDIQRLSFHVELRAVAMMQRTGVESAEVVINHVPCGYETRPPGCHQVLSKMLPPGNRLTVYGTDGKGRPYQRTYQGEKK